MRALWLAVLLAGCVHVAPREPALPMPERPEIAFLVLGNSVCMTVEDANLLHRWVLKLDAFEAARLRLLQAQ